MNRTILIIIIVLIVIVGGYFLLKGGYQAPAPTAPAPTAPATPAEGVTVPSVKEFTVSGTEFSFNPSSITVSAGEKVKLTFRNDGSIVHNLIISGLGVGTKTIGSGQTDTIEFIAPVSGTYPIFCSLPGHRAAGMEGVLIVE